MSDERKACPFCGVSQVSAWAGIVQCDTCHGTTAGDSQSDAIAAWNRRTVTREQAEKMAREIRGGSIGGTSEAKWEELTSGQRAIWEVKARNALRAAGFEVAE